MLFFLNISHAEFRYAFDIYTYAQKNEVADSIINLNNRIFNSPHSEAVVDLRGEIKWLSNNHLILARPRLLGTYKAAENDLESSTESKTQLDLSDLFHEYYWTSKISTTVGLQVYQWGPSEIMNPSNSLYHFNPRQKSAVYKEKGQVLLRGNLSTDKENSFVLIIQPVSNNEPEWIAEDEFKPKLLFKYEKSWTNTANYVGFVIGTEEKSNPYFGEYFNYGINDSISLYADVKHSQLHNNYIPVAAGASFDMELERDYIKNQWPSLGVFGFRWEGDFDFRFEYVYNGLGFNKQTLNEAIISAADITNPNYSRNIKRFLKPGLELLGQNYIYLSYRINEPFSLKELNFYSRYIQSLQDDSSQFQLEFDKALYDSYLIFSNIGFINGAIDSEFRLINDWQILAGFKWGI